MKTVGIIGTGHYVPEKVVTNDDIVRMGLDTSDQWILERTGIKERRIAPEEMASSDLAYNACKMAMENAHVKPEEIDLMLVATTTPDYKVFPSTACLLQAKLGLRNIGAMDLSAACSGFNYALTTAEQFIKAGQIKKALVVGVDSLSKFVDWEDRSVCILFGDGAGAVVLSEVKEGFGILVSDIYADGHASDVLKVKTGGSKYPLNEARLKNKEHLVYMDGKAVFKLAINRLVPTIKDLLKRVNLEAKDIDFFIPHQANVRIIEQARTRLALEKEQVILNIHKYGNTSSASIPIALSETVAAGRLKDGDIIVTIGFGAGFTWAANIIKWVEKG
jgi:3-oxoacyl-[acyl-carrier-protein] synthase-3